jgi:hypothetical protein
MITKLKTYTCLHVFGHKANAHSNLQRAQFVSYKNQNYQDYISIFS